jgi:glycosyltransferase involved in cell wall biosynthesis
MRLVRGGRDAPSPPPRVSVVVPTYQRPELLQRCLDALARQRMPAGSYEVIVVDDGRSDETREQVLALRARWPSGTLTYLRPPSGGRGPAQARNCGWRAARAALVAFTDDDTQPQEDWLVQGVSALRRAPALSALGGRVVVPRRAGDAPPSDHERMTRGLETARFVTANAFVRRDALEWVGGFDERFTRAWREDSDLQFRLEHEVGPVGRCDSAVVLHPVREEPWGVSLRTQKNVYFDALLYRKHPRRYRREIRRIPPWDHYVVVLCMLLALGAVLAQRGTLAVAPGVLALGLVARLSLQRLRGASHAPAHVVEMVATSALIPFLSVWWRLRGAWHFRTWFV